MAGKKYQLIIIFAALFIIGIAWGYFYFSKKFPAQQHFTENTAVSGLPSMDDLFTVRIYYPMDGRLQMEERRVQRRTSQTAVAEDVIGEFLKGPVNTKAAVVPRDVKLLGLYKGDNGIIYIDLSDEFRRNFSGDAAAEFLLLKSLFESLISNVQDIVDVKILIEGREMENLGGHIYLLYPLRDVVSQATEG